MLNDEVDLRWGVEEPEKGRKKEQNHLPHFGKLVESETTYSTYEGEDKRLTHWDGAGAAGLAIPRFNFRLFQSFSFHVRSNSESLGTAEDTIAQELC